MGRLKPDAHMKRDEWLRTGRSSEEFAWDGKVWKAGGLSREASGGSGKAEQKEEEQRASGRG